MYAKYVPLASISFCVKLQIFLLQIQYHQKLKKKNHLFFKITRLLYIVELVTQNLNDIDFLEDFFNIIFLHGEIFECP